MPSLLRVVPKVGNPRCFSTKREREGGGPGQDARSVRLEPRPGARGEGFSVKALTFTGERGPDILTQLPGDLRAVESARSSAGPHLGLSAGQGREGGAGGWGDALSPWLQ